MSDAVVERTDRETSAVLAPLKYLFVMGVAWATIASSAVVVPAIIGSYVIWSYCNIDKRRLPDASYMADAMRALSLGKGSVAGYRPSARERRRTKTVVRGLWMPFFVAIPTCVILVCVGLASGFLHGEDITLGLAYPVLLSIGVMLYMIARTPKGGW
jgi:hypothetical protein